MSIVFLVMSAGNGFDHDILDVAKDLISALVNLLYGLID